MSSTPVFQGDYDSSLTQVESGYHSACGSAFGVSEVYFTPEHVAFLNCQLQHLEPDQILQWALITFPGLRQETAFGLTGLVTRDMLSKSTLPLKQTVDLIFLDTLYHFPETLELLDRVQQRYPATQIHVFKPQGAENAQEFEARYGERLWETNEELYDFTAKVEPVQRAYRQLNVKAVLTGRRRSQGGGRGLLDIVEVDETGLIKINPLARWSFDQVQSYVKEHNVPYNPLLDQGYRSIGDWHSTQPVADGEEERAGRWKGRPKTECGIHNKRSRYAQFLAQQEEKERQANMAQLQKALEQVAAT